MFNAAEMSESVVCACSSAFILTFARSKISRTPSFKAPSCKSLAFLATSFTFDDSADSKRFLLLNAAVGVPVRVSWPLVSSLSQLRPAPCVFPVVAVDFSTSSPPSRVTEIYILV